MREHLLKICVLIAACALTAVGQASVRPAAVPVPPGPAVRWRLAGSNETSERSIKVDPRVNLSLCVVEGTVNVNGWARDEIRVFVKDGSKIGFKVQQKNRQNDSPVWVMAIGSDPGVPASAQNECLWGKSIDIDVPINSSINIKGKETRTSIDTVRKASVKNIGGDIVLRNIAEGVSASTYEGDVAVENTDGPIMLESSTGNIVAIDAGPSQVGDIFKVKTNSGAISLQKLEHRQVEVNSISGSVMYNGDLLSGGTYSFGTTNGSIVLSIPQNTSSKVSASFGYGNFNSDVPIKVLTEDVSPNSVKRMNGVLGAGDALLNLTTSSGRIVIKKL
jgi:hypothetical protein